MVGVMLLSFATLAVAINYLLRNRPQWSPKARVGKTLVSSRLIDRVVASLGRELYEVPVGFKYFTPGLHDGSLCFGGEESAGACFLRRDGTTWVTEKDGLLLGLLAAEILARTGLEVGAHRDYLFNKLGKPEYSRSDSPCSAEQKAAFKNLTAEAVTAAELAGEPIHRKLVRAPGNNEPIGGLKVETEIGWFAARPSGTEALYKLYAESFQGKDHLAELTTAANALLDQALK